MATQAAPQTTMPTATTWTLDPAHSAAGFRVRHLMIATVKGSVPIAGGTATWDGKDPATLRIEADLDPAGIQTGAADRDAHLRSADFFDVETHPTMRYVSTRVVHVQESEFRVEGDLTIRGVTRPAVLAAHLEGFTQDPWGKQRAIARATARIDRTDWGLTWNQALETGGILVGDEIRIEIDAQFVAQ